jgi:DNA polymerase III sliding clamp (beta) subunit (PCNA family)
MKRMALILTESDHGVKLDFNEGELVIRSQTQDDESQEDIKVQFDHCASIAFNPHYLIEPLKRLSCEEVTLRFSHSHAAASLSTNDDFLYVLMPMRM